MDLCESQQFDSLVLITGQRNADGGEMKDCLLEKVQIEMRGAERWPPCYQSNVKRGVEGRTGSAHRGENRASCQKYTLRYRAHSSGVRWCDSPWHTNHTGVKGQPSADIWWTELLSISFIVSLPLNSLFTSLGSTFILPLVDPFAFSSSGRHSIPFL